MERPPLVALSFVLACAQFATAAAPVQSDPLTRSFASDVQPLVTKYCVGCHGPKTSEAELRLDTLATTFDADGVRQWRHVLERIESGQMPPEDKPQPTAAEKAKLTGWISDALRSAELARRAKEGRVALRRLNRNEYQNTIHDLFGIQVELIEQLPSDGSADGFDNAAA